MITHLGLPSEQPEPTPAIRQLAESLRGLLHPELTEADFEEARKYLADPYAWWATWFDITRENYARFVVFRSSPETATGHKLCSATDENGRPCQNEILFDGRGADAPERFIFGLSDRCPAHQEVFWCSDLSGVESDVDQVSAVINKKLRRLISADFTAPCVKCSVMFWFGREPVGLPRLFTDEAGKGSFEW